VKQAVLKEPRIGCITASTSKAKSHRNCNSWQPNSRHWPATSSRLAPATISLGTAEF